MSELIKKYAVLLLLGFLLSRILTALTLTLIPNLLTWELLDGGTSSLSHDYLRNGFDYVINIGFIMMLSRDMGKERLKSSLILIMTFFSSFIGVVIFLLAVAFNKLNPPNIELHE